ncbi:energy-converting hydrogenase A subunit K EhaK [Methanobrevibacter ruminantium M1]|uniref:Energy-converting hydrogenase A subunit K EhaK n=1 Tax=Methanobrevibacter ruminantium (strain ATCC 35063 / DSM 1093 / JCM 13430 / OCM 146 / M1) TaxID=634498 RepID=D3E3Z1_METRM|nr:energy-converting hydrogenase A subunit K EhaK [Methanobrevibacter ruminantium M1]
MNDEKGMRVLTFISCFRSLYCCRFSSILPKHSSISYGYNRFNIRSIYIDAK